MPSYRTIIIPPRYWEGNPRFHKPCNCEGHKGFLWPTTQADAGGSMSVWMDSDESKITTPVCDNCGEVHYYDLFTGQLATYLSSVLMSGEGYPRRKETNSSFDLRSNDWFLRPPSIHTPVGEYDISCRYSTDQNEKMLEILITLIKLHYDKSYEPES